MHANYHSLAYLIHLYQKVRTSQTVYPPVDPWRGHSTSIHPTCTSSLSEVTSGLCNNAYVVQCTILHGNRCWTIDIPSTVCGKIVKQVWLSNAWWWSLCVLSWPLQRNAQSLALQYDPRVKTRGFLWTEAAFQSAITIKQALRAVSSLVGIFS